MSSEKIGKCRKVLKTIFRQFLKIFGNSRKFSKVFGNARKTLETLGKFSNTVRSLREIFIIFQSDTCGLKIGFKKFDL